MYRQQLIQHSVLLLLLKQKFAPRVEQKLCQ